MRDAALARALPADAGEVAKGRQSVQWPIRAVSRMAVAHLLVVCESLRPRHWIKNAFVLAAPFFGARLTSGTHWGAAIAACAAFCAVAGAVYLLNDVADRAYDRLDPRKRRRPVASGRLGVGEASLLATVLLVCSVCAAWFLATPATALVLCVYALLNALYSMWLKRIVVVDVLVLATGYVLRVVAGGVATGAQPSEWLLLCTLNLALFLGLAKRRAELIHGGAGALNRRKVLQAYAPVLLDQLIGVATTATLVCYVLYALDAQTALGGRRYGLALTLPFVIHGLFRYLYLAYARGEGASPTETVLRDRPLQAGGLLWVGACAVLVYSGG